jgi:DNA excision repair protein ERCC-2
MQVFFPYDNIRNEQKQLIHDVAEVISGGKVLFAHAPTGLGKTVSSLAPAIAYALEQKKKIFFITPKISQHEIVLETIKLMNEKFSLNIKAVDLVGRRAMCIDPMLSSIGYSNGFYEACLKKKKNKACQFYTNTKGYTPKQKTNARKRKASLLKEFNKSHEEIRELCSMQELCPYEITLELAREADVIIGDYFHLFNDEIREGIIAQAGFGLGDVIAIIDEAHNLGNRLRDMMSCSLDLKIIEKAEKESKNTASFDAELAIKDIKKEIEGIGKKLSFDRREAVIPVEELDVLKKIARDSLEKISIAGEKFMKKYNAEGSFLLNVEHFLSQLIREKEHTLHVIERKSSLGIGINPLDPAEISAPILNKVSSAILMSGTLLPLEMHADIFGAKKFVLKEYKSPFPSENRLNLFVDKTTTKYGDRSSIQYDEIAFEVNRIISKVPGNTIVFFPSFELLEVIAPRIKTSRKVLKQEREMMNEEKGKLIHNFKLLGSSFGGVLLAVSGGSIAEGVDFPGEHLACAIIVGIPFAKVSIHTDAMIKFFEQKFGSGKGFEYAYTAPAIGKAVQAAGRVIRTETDKGICVFLDKRFSDEKYKKFFPKDFVAEKTIDAEKEVAEFFK